MKGFESNLPDFLHCTLLYCDVRPGRYEQCLNSGPGFSLGGFDKTKVSTTSWWKVTNRGYWSKMCRCCCKKKVAPNQEYSIKWIDPQVMGRAIVVTILQRRCFVWKTEPHILCWNICQSVCLSTLSLPLWTAETLLSYSQIWTAYSLNKNLCLHLQKTKVAIKQSFFSPLQHFENIVWAT